MVSLASRRLVHRAPGLILRLLVIVCAALGFVAAAKAAPTCPSDSKAAAPLHLPHLRAALASRVEGLVVALGSSSTEGAMASDPAHTYPAVLQSALAAALPSAHIAVINRGIGGQDAPEERARLETDVIALRPQLVIWQVGANGAMRRADPADFARTVAEGVDQLRTTGIDVILMDNQRAPRVVAAARHLDFEATLARVAQTASVNLFSRSALMDAWSQQGMAPARFIAADDLHHNDLGYFCIATILARRIVAAIHEPVTVSASR